MTNDKMVESMIVVLAGIALLVFFVFITGFPTMWLWNSLMPDIFNLPRIGFWQAVGINFLTGILFRPVTYSKSKG